jgi:hypothetical protein
MEKEKREGKDGRGRTGKGRKREFREGQIEKGRSKVEQGMEEGELKG